MEIIAFYLPQYHPTPHNNEWWGEGFTEWTNVAKAKPLFRGHYQPKVPADLGFYDLRMPEVREKQAKLAVEAGITGFCYYHYWFGNGEQELELPFNEVVKSGNPDFPFCLCWANESWYKKFWNKDGGVTDKKELAVQVYPGEADDVEHFNSLLSAFRDKRYIRINGKLLFMVYKPLQIPEPKKFMELWRKLAKDNDVDDFIFVGFTFNPDTEYNTILELGYDAVASCRLGYGKQGFLMTALRKIISLVVDKPMTFNYKTIYPTLISTLEKEKSNAFPTMIPNWDHTPRSGNHGYLYTNSTPNLFEKHAEQVLEAVKDKPSDAQVCFVKSWNEWGEGNYLEPDLKYGKGYIYALRKAIKTVFNQ